MSRWTGWCFICSKNGPCFHLDWEQKRHEEWDRIKAEKKQTEDKRDLKAREALEAKWQAETQSQRSPDPNSEEYWKQCRDAGNRARRDAGLPELPDNWWPGQVNPPEPPPSPAQAPAPAKKWHIPEHTRRPLPELEPTRPPKRIRCRPGPTHESKRLQKAREQWEKDTRRLQQPDPYAYMGVFPRTGYALAQWMTLESAFQTHLIDQAISAERRVIKEHFPIQQFSEMYQMPNNARDYGHRYMKGHTRDERSERCDP